MKNTLFAFFKIAIYLPFITVDFDVSNKSLKKFEYTIVKGLALLG